MLPRFFAPHAHDAPPVLALPEDEAHHATRVLRLRPGADIAVFDGAGHEWRGRILSVGRARVEVELLDRVEPAAEPRVHLTLLQAVLKGDHMDAVIRDATMAGARAIVPVLTVHTAVNAGAAATARAHERWLRVAVASAKQCRRAVIPAIHPVLALPEAIPLSVQDDCARRVVLVEPAAADGLGAPLAGEGDRAVLAVGPEGGWSAQELKTFAEAGFAPLTLGALTLRADAAALVAISVLRARWNDW